jgi:hypothetical protein
MGSCIATPTLPYIFAPAEFAAGATPPAADAVATARNIEPAEPPPRN